MPIPKTSLLIVLALSGMASSCDRSRYQEPPDTMYSLAAFDLKTGTAPAEQVSGALVSKGFFATAQVLPLLGRTFLEEEYQSGAPVVVLSHELWTRRFTGAPDVIGTTIALNGRRTTIVGILPPGFAAPKGAALWLPVARPVS